MLTAIKSLNYKSRFNANQHATTTTISMERYLYVKLQLLYAIKRKRNTQQKIDVNNFFSSFFASHDFADASKRLRFRKQTFLADI